METRQVHPRVQSRYGPLWSLPPPFKLVTLRERGDAVAHACRIAAEQGAGTLVSVGRFDTVEFALVLEPEEPLRSARRAFYAGLVALGDALAAHAPPEKPISYAWPRAIQVDGGMVGRVCLAWPDAAHEDAIPEWLVFGAAIRTAILGADDPGAHPATTALEEEGFEDLGPGRLVETFARHFLRALDRWDEQGFSALARDYVARLSLPAGTRAEIDEAGDLLLKRVGEGAPERRSLVAALQSSTWDNDPVRW